MVVPDEYIIQKFYQHAGYPKFVRSTNTYMGGCPICREGASWGRKSRCYYIPKDSKVCCHNCGWYSSPINWIMEVEQVSYNDIVTQIQNCDYEYGIPKEQVKVKTIIADLPDDSINLFDPVQLKYYSSNNIVRIAAETIVKRRLNTAINRPKSLYVSLTDNIHKERLILPFYNGKDCVFYQSRSLLETQSDRPKYLSKLNSDKTLFNYNQVESSSEHVFITEGPIDSFFIKNSVAVAGIQERSKQTLTTTQQKQIDKLFLTQSVWVLDSQWNDSASLRKSEVLLKSGQCVFIWPKDIGRKFKDINDLCVYFKIDEIKSDYILKHTYCGLKGIVKNKQIR